MTWKGAHHSSSLQNRGASGSSEIGAAAEDIASSGGICQDYRQRRLVEDEEPSKTCQLAGPIKVCAKRMPEV